MINRYLTSVLGALIMTFLLFLGMHSLIATGELSLVEEKDYIKVEIGEIIKIADIKDKIEQPVRPEPPKIDFIDLPSTTSKSDNPTLISDMTPTLTPTLTPGTFTFPRGIGLMDGDILPLRKSTPAYPFPMKTRGIEGYVVIKFTITKTGAVENAMIVESTNEGFNRASLRAVEKFKYKPRIIDSVSVEVTNMVEKITFQMASD